MVEGRVHECAPNATLPKTVGDIEIHDRDDTATQVWIVGGMIEQVADDSAFYLRDQHRERRRVSEAFLRDLRGAECRADWVADATQNFGQLRRELCDAADVFAVGVPDQHCSSLGRSEHISHVHHRQDEIQKELGSRPRVRAELRLLDARQPVRTDTRLASQPAGDL